MEYRVLAYGYKALNQVCFDLSPRKSKIISVLAGGVQWLERQPAHPRVRLDSIPSPGQGACQKQQPINVSLSF